MSSPLGTDSEEETKSESFLEEKEQDTKTTSLRYSKAPIFGAFHRRIRKMPLVKQHIDRSRSSSTPRKVHALSGLRLTTIVCGETMMAAYATPSLERLSVSCGPFSGGTPIELYGSAFWPSDEIQVRFSFQDMEILVPGEFKEGVVKCVSPTLDVKVEKSACVDVIFGPGSETRQGLPFMYYGKVTSTAMTPCLGAARGGWIARISGTGFRDVDSALVRFRPDDSSENAFYTSATYESETDTFVCNVPNVSSDGFPGNVFVDISLNGIDYEEVDEDTQEEEDDYEDEEEKQGPRRIKILMYDDEIVRCVPYAVQFKDDTSTTLRLRGRGFPRSTRDRNFEVTVKLTLKDQEYTTTGVVEGSTKVSCVLPKLTREDLFGEDKSSGSVLTHVSMTFDGVNFSNSFPLYMYAGQLGTVEPSCGPITGGETIRLKSSWFFPSENIKIRFRGSSKSIVVHGTFDNGDIVCDMPKYPTSDTVSLAVAMDGSNFMSRTESGSALKYTIFNVPVVSHVSFADDSICRIEDAANEHVEMVVQGLDSSSSSVRLKVTRMFDDDEVVVKMIDSIEIEQEESE
eukprot:g2861.t1